MEKIIFFVFVLFYSKLISALDDEEPGEAFEYGGQKLLIENVPLIDNNN